MQVKLSDISYIGTSFKFGLNRILVYSGFDLDRLHRILKYAKYIS